VRENPANFYQQAAAAEDAQISLKRAAQNAAPAQ
jgi:hypothetical protein